MQRSDVVTEAAQQFVSYLPDVVWYLTQDGRDMWCRRPYGFFFTSSEAAARFAGAIGTSFELSPIGVAARELISQEGLAALRALAVTRVFVDPELDEATGDVTGRILRLEPVQ